MNKERLVINTLVYLDDLNKGVGQAELLKEVDSLGIKKIEIRREFIKDFEIELDEIFNEAMRLNMEIYYSIPHNFYDKAILNEEVLIKYFKEAERLGAKKVKMALENLEEIKKDDVTSFNDLIKQYNMDLFTIENGQSSKGSFCQNINTFIGNWNSKGGMIKLTFDTGNWLWVGEDPLANARELKDLVAYIHLKDVTKEENLNTSYLNEGLVPWKEILEILPKDVDVALEYPCGKDATNVLKSEISKLIREE